MNPRVNATWVDRHHWLPYIAAMFTDDDTATRTRRIIDEYARIAFADMSDYGEWDRDFVTLFPSRQLTPEQSAAVSEVKQTRQGVQIKLHDKQKALDALARIHGMFIERHDHTSSDGSMSPKDVDPSTVKVLVDKLTG